MEKTAEPPRTLGPRERRLVLVAGAMIGCWLLVSWVVQPLWDHARDLHVRVQTHTEKLDALSRLLTRLPSIERQYQQVAGYLVVEDDEAAHSAFLNELEALTRRSGVQMNLKRRAAREEERLSRFEVELDVEGSQDNLLTFLDNLLGMPALIVVERLRISIVPTKAQALRANLVIQKLTFRQ